MAKTFVITPAEEKNCVLCDVLIEKRMGAWISNDDLEIDDYYFVCPDCYYEYSEEDIKIELEHDEKVFWDRIIQRNEKFLNGERLV